MPKPTGHVIPPKRLLRAEEAACMLGLSVTGLYHWTARGLLPRPRKFGRRGRWYAADLERFLQQLPVKPPRKAKGTPKGAPQPAGLRLAREGQGGKTR